ncbi:MAG: hypothetical protein WCA89_03025 [Terracidiphilus sp.]
MSENQHLVRDVIVQTIPHDLWVSDEVFSAEPPVDGRVELGNGLWVGSLDFDTVQAVFDACDPPGLNFCRTRLLFQRYCFVREQRHSSYPSLNWDDDLQLRKCVDLSRLVHPTTIATHFSARLFYENGDDSKPSMIVPGLTQGLGAYAWVNGSSWRNWLTEQDARELGKLVPTYDFDKMPIRLRRAMNHFLYSCFTYYPDMRLLLIVAGLEALVNTSRNHVTAQFKKRLALAAIDVGMVVSEDSTKVAYANRSLLIHGQGLQTQGFDRAFSETYEQLEELLRKLIKKSIADQKFSSNFESKESIDNAYPV